MANNKSKYELQKAQSLTSTGGNKEAAKEFLRQQFKILRMLGILIYVATFFLAQFGAKILVPLPPVGLFLLAIAGVMLFFGRRYNGDIIKTYSYADVDPDLN